MHEQLSYIVCRDCRRVFIFDEDARDHKDQTGHQQFDNLDFDNVFGNETAAQLRIVLQQAIIASLKSLGEKAMNSVIWHLNNNHILINSDNLNIKKFYENLQEIIGPSADAVMESVVHQLVLHYKVNTGRDLCEVDSISDRSPDEKLLYVMKTILGLKGWL